MPNKNVANAVGGKTARACDSCVRKRARWYCAADDAFLCQSCDASVHSANPLARRHERVRLKVASALKHADDVSVPTWHRGFKRKARTPRHHGNSKLAGHVPKSEETSPRQTLPLVPEVGGDETTEENDDEQLLYRVPIYDPFMAELCTSSNSNEAGAMVAAEDVENKDVNREVKALLAGYGQDVDNLDGFLPSDMDLAEFAADVESLLGGGIESECYGMEGLGLMTAECRGRDSAEILECGKVKVEEEEEDVVVGCHAGEGDVDLARETFELNFDYDSTATCGEEEEEKVAVGAVSGNGKGGEVDLGKKKRTILLNLDYESVIAAWASQGSPWTTGSRPDIDADECWPDCMGSCGADHIHNNPNGEMVMSHSAAGVMGDGGREARVSRYREKRRTRLFSKKIRYEVRKLNAEKRPRMKGRFVKRASSGGGSVTVTTATGSGSSAPAYPLLKK